MRPFAWTHRQDTTEHPVRPLASLAGRPLGTAPDNKHTQGEGVARRPPHTPPPSTTRSQPAKGAHVCSSSTAPPPPTPAPSIAGTGTGMQAGPALQCTQPPPSRCPEQPAGGARTAVYRTSAAPNRNWHADDPGLHALNPHRRATLQGLQYNHTHTTSHPTPRAG